jgi:quinoprotein glucose dehydrogenase
MNTGEHLWVIPNGDAELEEQETIKNHPLLQGVPNVPTNPGRRGFPVMVATPTLLITAGQIADGTWNLFAIDKKTGERVGAVPIPGETGYGMSSWVHNGKQYVLVQLEDGLAAMALPGPEDAKKPTHH